jgi:hypothetical protein
MAVEIMAKTNAMSAKNLIWLCQHIAILPTMILVSILER